MKAMRAHLFKGMLGALRKEVVGSLGDDGESWEGRAVRAVKRNWRKVIRRPVHR